MAKTKTQYVCSDCGEVYPTWLGKCGNCGAFNTLKEFREAKIQGKDVKSGTDLSVSESKSKLLTADDRINTKIAEVDRVLGGGFFPGSVTLFGGHPGIGKSTLALQIFLNIPHFDKGVSGGISLYFSGEESVDQVRNRASRLTNNHSPSTNNLFSTNSLEDIVATIEAQKPEFVVIDSIQMVGLQDSSFGTTSQIRENAELLIKLAKATGTTILIIGHVTKNDELAGPKVLEHLVDVVLYLEGDRNSELRLLRAPKNRFGSTLEVGLFEMVESGLKEMTNPVEFFLEARSGETHGSVITTIRDGVRNFMLELQVLTVKTNFGQPRRTSHGFDLSKFHLLLAVVAKFTTFPCAEHDAYLNVIGGLRIQDPAADLAIIAATLSSRLEKEIPADTVVIGEVGLSGEVRRVPQLDARLAEMAKLGFKNAIVPASQKSKVPNGLNVKPVHNVAEIIAILFPHT